MPSCFLAESTSQHWLREAWRSNKSGGLTPSTVALILLYWRQQDDFAWIYDQALVHQFPWCTLFYISPDSDGHLFKKAFLAWVLIYLYRSSRLSVGLYSINATRNNSVLVFYTTRRKLKHASQFIIVTTAEYETWGCRTKHLNSHFLVLQTK